jgi:hypothetical protein
MTVYLFLPRNKYHQVHFNQESWNDSVPCPDQMPNRVSTGPVWIWTPMCRMMLQIKYQTGSWPILSLIMSAWSLNPEGSVQCQRNHENHGASRTFHGSMHQFIRLLAESCEPGPFLPADEPLLSSVVTEWFRFVRAISRMSVCKLKEWSNRSP